MSDAPTTRPAGRRHSVLKSRLAITDSTAIVEYLEERHPNAR